MEEGDDPEYDIVLFQSNLIMKEHFDIFVAESSTSAILDCGASATVSGLDWFKNYLDGLSNEKQSQVTYSESNAFFKFGSGEKFKSMYKVCFPATIGSNEVFIESDIVSNNIPLLLSLKSMKKAGTEINYVTDTVKMFGEEQRVNFTQSGHYTIPLNNSRMVMESVEKNPNTKVVLYNNASMDKKKMAVKLHAQFGHPPKSRLVKLLERAGYGNDKELLDQVTLVYKSCSICQQYQKPTPRPCVSLPHADQFNETVAMDLKSFNGHIILHLIDHLTRYSAAWVCKSKAPKEIVSGIMRCWVSIFGVPRKFLTDNGGEFANELFIEMAEQFGIRVMTTAAESPWSNGLVERHNATLAEILYKITAENESIDIETAVAWAINAKNALTNVSGFSPSQLALGCNPQIPNVFSCKPPAFETSSQDIVKKNLLAISATRKAFIQAESSERIKRALKRNIRPNAHAKFFTGDIVFYKRNDSRKWKGPGRVIGSESSNILIKHGSYYVRVHASRVMLDINAQHKSDDVENPKSPAEEQHEMKSNDEENVAIKDFSDTESYSSQEKPVEPEETEDSSFEEKFEECQSEEVQNEYEKQSRKDETKKSTCTKMKKGMRIEFEKADGDVKLGTVLKRSGKATGKYRNYWYIQNENTGQTEEYDIINDWNRWRELQEPGLDQEIFICEDEAQQEKLNRIFEAKRQEVQKWMEEKVMEEVDDIGQRFVSTTWVITDKKVGPDVFVKARLVARGYEDESSVRSDSPTCQKDSIRLLLVLAVSRGWNIHCLDIKAAFLQGKDIERELYVLPPKEFKKPNLLWRLRKVVYGLNDASRSWYLKVVQVLESLNMRTSSFDKAVFVPKDCSTIGVIIVHVDDIMYFGNDDFINTMINPFKTAFKISKEESKAFRYLGINLIQESDYIQLDQNSYLESVKSELLDKEYLKEKDREACASEVKVFKQGVGQLGWMATISKPEASYMYCQLSTIQSNPLIRDFVKYRKVINELKNNPSCIIIRPLNLENLFVNAYSDASFASLEGGASQLGYFVFLSDDHNNVALISWSSKKAKRVCRSALTAETLAASEALDCAFVTRKMMEDVLQRKLPPVQLSVDSKSLYDTVRTSNVVADKRLMIDVSAMREMLDREEMKMKWVDTNHQLADVLTKAGSNKDKLLDVLSSGFISDLN